MTTVVILLIATVCVSSAGLAQAASPVLYDLALEGRCKIIWTNYASSYVLPMWADWERNGTFSWVSMYKHQPGSERGQAIIIQAPVRMVRPDGTWEVRQLVANNVGMGDSYACCCEYLSGSVIGYFPVTYTDYCRTSKVARWQEACEAFDNQPCPVDNSSALVAFHEPPYHEVYSSCQAEQTTIFM